MSAQRRDTILAACALAAISAIYLTRGASPSPPTPDAISPRTVPPQEVPRVARARPARTASPADAAPERRDAPEGPDESAPAPHEDTGTAWAPALMAPDSPALAEAIDDSMREVMPTIHQCLLDWSVEHPALEGSVDLTLEFGPEGLRDVEAVDHEGTPTEVLSCFAPSLYEVDWPALSAPLALDYPIRFSVESG